MPLRSRHNEPKSHAERTVEQWPIEVLGRCAAHRILPIAAVRVGVRDDCAALDYERSLTARRLGLSEDGEVYAGDCIEGRGLVGHWNSFHGRLPSAVCFPATLADKLLVIRDELPASLDASNPSIETLVTANFAIQQNGRHHMLPVVPEPPLAVVTVAIRKRDHWKH